VGKSQAMTRWLSIPDVFDESVAGHALVFFCIPNTRGWRGNATKAVRSLAYGRNYNEDDGSVRDVVAIGKEVFNTMTICSFDEIIAAIQGITIQNTVNVYGGGGTDCSCAGPSDAPSLPADPTEEPPPGWEPATDDEGVPLEPDSDEYKDRKCAMSWAIQTQIEGLLQKMIDSGWDDTLAAFSSGGYAVASLMIGYMIGELSTPFPILDGLIGAALGWLANLVIKLFVGDVDVTALNTAVYDNRDDLVCALYSSVNATGAANDYLQVLADAGVSIANREVILAILGYDLVNLIFFKNSKLSQSLEDAVLSTSWPSCDTCCEEYYVPWGTLVDDQLPSHIDIQSVETDAFACDFGFANSSRLQLSFVDVVPLDPCTPIPEIPECFAARTLVSVSIIAGTFTGLAVANLYINHSGGLEEYSGFPVAWTGSLTGIKSIGTAGDASTTYTVRMEFV